MISCHPAGMIRYGIVSPDLQVSDTIVPSSIQVRLGIGLSSLLMKDAIVPPYFQVRHVYYVSLLILCQPADIGHLPCDSFKSKWVPVYV